VTPCTAPTVSVQPISKAVNVGQTATFTAAATTETTPTVQWQVSVNHGSTWTDLAGSTSPTLSGSPTPLANGWEFRARFTNPIGSATTNAAILTVNPSTSVAFPSEGTVVTGNQYLDATATAGATQVQFQLTGGTLHNAAIATAAPSLIGWLASWNSTTVPNGTYTLQSVATFPGGDTATTPGITIVVNNPPPTSTIALPSDGATLSGAPWLDATASAGVNAVQFVLTGGTLDQAVIATATPTLIGWLANWTSTTVPNGTYTLQSVASYSSGVTGMSPGVTITVSN
jgi:hypothetical protein